jgi:hypothetical protein
VTEVVPELPCATVREGGETDIEEVHVLQAEDEALLIVRLSEGVFLPDDWSVA